MKNINYCLLTLFIFSVSSCCNDKGNFIIVNNSTSKIDSITLSPDSNGKIISLEIGEKKNLNICMNKVNSDGSYEIRYWNSKTKKNSKTRIWILYQWFSN